MKHVGVSEFVSGSRRRPFSSTTAIRARAHAVIHQRSRFGFHGVAGAPIAQTPDHETA